MEGNAGDGGGGGGGGVKGEEKEQIELQRVSQQDTLDVSWLTSGKRRTVRGRRGKKIACFKRHGHHSWLCWEYILATL